MSFITKLFKSSKPNTSPTVTAPSVTDDSSAASPITKTKRGARLALFATQGGSFGVTGNTPTARRKLLGNG